MANETTTNYGWTIEEEYADPYYEQAKTIRNEIDATVYGIDQRVVDVEADSLNAEYLWEQPIDEILDGETDGLRVADTKQNDTKYPEDMRQWVTATTVAGAADELIANGDSSGHGLSRTITQPATKVTTTTFKMMAGDKEWVKWNNFSTISHILAINANTGEVSQATDLLESGSYVMGDGYRLCWLTASIPAGSFVQDVKASTDGTNTTYTGDSATVDLYIKDVHTFDGYIRDNVKYANGVAAAVAPTTTVAKLVYKQAKWDAGLVQKAGDPNVVTNWILASSVDGDLMDASAGNVDVLHANNKLKRASTGTWETPIPATFGNIDSVASASGGAACTITAHVAHGLSNGDQRLVIVGNFINDVYTVSNVTTLTFDIQETYISTGIGGWSSLDEYESADQRHGAVGTVYTRVIYDDNLPHVFDRQEWFYISESTACVLLSVNGWLNDTVEPTQFRGVGTTIGTSTLEFLPYGLPNNISIVLDARLTEFKGIVEYVKNADEVG